MSDFERLGLVPTLTAFAVVNLLERHFGELVRYEFTARMEDELDEIASGELHALSIKTFTPAQWAEQPS